MRRAIAGLVLLAAGCGGAAPCVRNDACGGGNVCRPDGTCGPLAPDPVVRAAHATRRFASGYAVRGDDARSDRGDAVLLGDGFGTLRLEFAALPVEDDPVAAELVLVPSPTRASAGASRVVVDVLETLDAPDVLVRGAAVRTTPGGPELVRVDVTRLAVAARAAGRTRLVLAVHAEGGPLAVGSPAAPDASLRPRLDVLAP